MFNEIKELYEKYERLKTEAFFKKLVEILFEVRPLGALDYELFALALDYKDVVKIINTKDRKELVKVVKNISKQKNKEWMNKHYSMLRK